MDPSPLRAAEMHTLSRRKGQRTDRCFIGSVLGKIHFLCIFWICRIIYFVVVLFNFVCRAFAGDSLAATKNINKIISQCARLHYPEETRLPEIHVCTCFTDYPEETKLKVHDDFLVSIISF